MSGSLVWFALGQPLVWFALGQLGHGRSSNNDLLLHWCVYVSHGLLHGFPEREWRGVLHATVVHALSCHEGQGVSCLPFIKTAIVFVACRCHHFEFCWLTTVSQ